MNQTLSKAQRQAMRRVDNILKNQGLPTYTQLEERCFMALSMAHEAVEMGRIVAKQLKDEVKPFATYECAQCSTSYDKDMEACPECGSTSVNY